MVYKWYIMVYILRFWNLSIFDKYLHDHNSIEFFLKKHENFNILKMVYILRLFGHFKIILRLFKDLKYISNIQMPKKDIDYSNTIIYKIYCRDSFIKYFYISHTTNFIQRRYAHKQSSLYNNSELYNKIRQNGGWDNWNMISLGCFDCKNCKEVREKVNDFYSKLNCIKDSSFNLHGNSLCNEWICPCGKKYKYNSGFYRHKKICQYRIQEINNDEDKTEDNYKKMFLVMINENKELRSQISQLIPKVGNNNNNNIKQKVNINIFLNEQLQRCLNNK